MQTGILRQPDAPLILALALPLTVRFLDDAGGPISDRLALIGLAVFVAITFALLFRRRRFSVLEGGFIPFAMLFALMVPGPVAWVGAVLALAFGWVFACEIFSGRPFLPPALLAIAFAIFSFPDGGYETVRVLSEKSVFALMLTVSCLPGAAWLIWKKMLAWQTIVGAMLGAGCVALIMAEPVFTPWWLHYFLGTFPIGIVFLSAMSECAPRTTAGRWMQGILIGALIVLARLANPDQPDGVAFALLFGCLFAPLLDRFASWRVRHGQA